MKKMRIWIVGLSAVALLAVGVAAVAGNGFGQSAARNLASGDYGACASQGHCTLSGPDADGDGVPNGQDSDWTCPQDGSGYGVRQGRGLGASGRGAMRSGSVGGCARGGCS